MLFFSDDPIQCEDEDILGRKKFVQDLYDEIRCLPFTDSFVFGLHGGWGEGKTSTLNLLKRKFEDKRNKDFLIVDFNPWQFKNEAAISRAFYKKLQLAVTEKYLIPGFKVTLQKYERILVSGLAYVGINIQPLVKEISLEEIRREIQSVLNQISKKILIIIDDIDRLQPSEIVRFFKLVRLNANFKNTIFLLSFDNKVVLQYFKNNLKLDAEYLEKIVQKSIPLPAIEKEDLDHFLDINIEQLFDSLHITKEDKTDFENDFSYLYQMHLKTLFITLRKSKEYLNGLRSTLSPIKAEVNLFDFCILEVIRIFYPEVYDDIWRNPWFYIHQYIFSPWSMLADENKKYEQIRGHLNKIIESQTSSDTLKALLTSIFPEANAALQEYSHRKHKVTERAAKLISKYECFPKYFLLKTPRSELSDEFVETIINLWNDTKSSDLESLVEQTIFSQQDENTRSQFLSKLLIFISYIKPMVAQIIIRVLYKNSAKFCDDRTDVITSSDFEKARNLLLCLINNKINSSEIQNTLEEVISKTSDLTFASHIVLSCERNRSGDLYNISESLDIDRLKCNLATRLKNHFILAKKDIFEELPESRQYTFVLHQWGTNWGSPKRENVKTVSDYVISLVNGNPSKLAKIILGYLGLANDGKTRTIHLNDMSLIYDLEKLRDFATVSLENKSLTQEEKDAIQLFIKTVDNKKPSSN